MVQRYLIHIFCIFALVASLNAEEAFGISHGPMLGAVSENTAAIWLRTSSPGEVTVTLSNATVPDERLIRKLNTTIASDNTGIVRFDKLTPNTKYRYVAVADESTSEGHLTTLDASLKNETVRMVFGYGFNHDQHKVEPGASVFTNMAARKANIILFLGDFPYTKIGEQDEVRSGNRAIREVDGFTELTVSTPTYGIYDDHDFGPNDCDGTHEHADGALAAFKEYWPNPSYGLPDDKGIYCSFVIGDVEFFLLDGRYPARKNEKTMLGKVQFNWLCTGLKNSKSRYKVLVSGTQFGRVKADSWAGKYYIDEREKLFSFISNNDISGVIAISGDIHRSDIYKLPIGGGRYFYDFTPGALAKKQRVPPDPLPATMIHSYGIIDDFNMYGEIDFSPSSDKDVAITFRSFSTKNGLIYEHMLSPEDLSIQTGDR